MFEQIEHSSRCQRRAFEAMRHRNYGRENVSLRRKENRIVYDHIFEKSEQFLRNIVFVDHLVLLNLVVDETLEQIPESVDISAEKKFGVI